MTIPAPLLAQKHTAAQKSAAEALSSGGRSSMSSVGAQRCWSCGAAGASRPRHQAAQAALKCSQTAFVARLAYRGGTSCNARCLARPLWRVT